MSGRAYKRLLQEREKQRMLQEIEAQSNQEEQPFSENEVEKIIPIPVKTKSNLFEFLTSTENDSEGASTQSSPETSENENEDDDSSNDESAYHAKKNKHKQLNTPKKVSKSKKKSSHLKGKTEDITEIELDQLLQQFVIENKDRSRSSSSSSSSSSTSSSPYDFLKIEPKYLNQETELTRIFGAHVVQQQRQEALQPYPGGRQQRLRHQARTRLKLRKSFLVTPTDQWPPMESIGLFMESCSTPFHFKYSHSSKYQSIHQQFLDAVRLFHPTPLLHLLEMYPSHPDTLFMLSRILEQQGDRDQAKDLLHRAIYTLETSALASFPWTQPPSRRLSYVEYENRILFLTLFKKIQFLANESCWRTALEWCKLLWSMHPEEDPLGCLFILDYYAIQAHAFEWLLKLIDSIPNAWAYPNLAFGQVWAYFFLNQREKARSLLIQAAQLYPYIGKHFCLETNVLPSMLSEELYITRMQTSLLKNKELTDWVQSQLLPSNLDPLTSLSNPPSLQKSSLPSKHLLPNQLDSLYRHILVSNHLPSSFSAALPEFVRHQSQFHDPYPPSVTRSPYLSMTSQQNSRSGIPANAHPLWGMFASLLPWNHEVTTPLPQTSLDTSLSVQELTGQLVVQLRDLVQGLVPSTPTSSESSTSRSQEDTVDSSLQEYTNETEQEEEKEEEGESQG